MMKAYLEKNGVKAEYMTFDKSCHTVKEAAETLGIPEEEIVKNVCFADKQGNIIVAIVPGNQKASKEKVSELLKRKISIANPKQILEKTGYPAGGVPSFGFSAIFLIDKRVMEKPVIYTSGGSPHSMVRISTSEMKRLSNGIVADVVV